MTGKSKSFIEILESEIRNDLRQEIEAEVLAQYGVRAGTKKVGTPEFASPALHAAGRFETWLASNIGRTTFARTQAAQASYKSNPAARKATSQTPKAPTPVPTSSQAPRVTAETPEQLCAVELLKRQSGARLEASFTEDELKSVWRKAALKTHPDRFVADGEIAQMRMTAIFRELCGAYELLLSGFATAQATAA